MRKAFLVAAVVAVLVAGTGHAADYVLYEEITVADTAIGITSTVLNPDGRPQMNTCRGKVLTAQIHYRYDGTAPTSSVGIPLEPGDWINVDNHADASRLRFIRTTATSGAVRINCWVR